MMESGERKSAVFKAATATLSDYEVQKAAELAIESCGCFRCRQPACIRAETSSNPPCGSRLGVVSHWGMVCNSARWPSSVEKEVVVGKLIVTGSTFIAFQTSLSS